MSLVRLYFKGRNAIALADILKGFPGYAVTVAVLDAGAGDGLETETKVIVTLAATGAAAESGVVDFLGKLQNFQAGSQAVEKIVVIQEEGDRLVLDYPSGAVLVEAVRSANLLAELLGLLGIKEREALGRGLVFEIGVPRAVFEAVVEFREFGQAEALGLLAVSPEGSVRVPRLLGLEEPQDEALAATAARELYEVWGESESEVEQLEIHRLAIEGKMGAIAAKLADTLSSEWNTKGRLDASIAICRRTLGVCDDYRVLSRLATAQSNIGAVIEGEKNYYRALELCDEADQKRKASILNALGDLQDIKGNIKKALELYEEALEISRMTDNKECTSASLTAIANIYNNQGNVDRAIVLYKESLKISRSIDNQQGTATTLCYLANAYNNQENIDGAITLYEESLQINRSIGFQQGIAATLHGMANVYSDQDEADRTIALYEESLQINRAVGHQRGIATTLHAIAVVYSNQGNIDGAIALYEESLQINRAIGHQQGIAATLHEMAKIYSNQGSVDGGIALYKESLQIERTIGNQRGIADTLAQLAGVLAIHRQDFRTAIDYLQESEAIFRRMGAPDADIVAQVLQVVRGMR
jgi:tetratricopeptide (TPR) repeat protein